MLAHRDPIATIAIDRLHEGDIALSFIFAVVVPGAELALAEQEVFFQDLVPFDLGGGHAITRSFPNMKDQPDVAVILFPLEFPRYVNILEAVPLVILLQLGHIVIRQHGIEAPAKKVQKLMAGVDLGIEACPADEGVPDEGDAADVDDRAFRDVENYARIPRFISFD